MVGRPRGLIGHESATTRTYALNPRPAGVDIHDMPAPSSARVPRGDAGNIVTGWLLKLTVILTVLGVIAFDAIALATTRIQLEDASEQAAFAAATTSMTRGNPRVALATAQKTLAEANTAYKLDETSFVLARDGSVSFTVHRTANTVVLKHISAAKKYTSYTASRKPVA